MYENETFEGILERTLARVPSDLDVRESSFMYNAVAPISVELQNMYIALTNIFNLTFFDTSDRDGKLQRCKERGIDITQFDATYSVVTANTTPADIDIPIGSRFNFEDVNFIVIAKVSDGVYTLQCETAGEVGNITGMITPIDYVNGLTYAEIVSIDTYGEEEAGIDEINTIFYASLNSQAFGGNKADYMLKLHQIDGVGGVKIYSANEWIGGGNVKVVIQTSAFTKPTTAFVNTVQNLVDPTYGHGKGYGIAPIGHTVAVFGVDEQIVNVSSRITLQEGYAWEDVKPFIEAVIDEYLLELNRQWQDTSNIIVRISQIETRILEITGVLDIADTMINGKEYNLTVDKDAIVVRGEINERT